MPDPSMHKPAREGDWPTRVVELNHLEAMGICMSLVADEHLSAPQHDALAKVQATLSLLLDDLERPR